MTLDLDKELKERLEKNKDKDMSKFIMEYASELAQAEKIANNLTAALFFSMEEEGKDSFSPAIVTFAISNFAAAILSGIEAQGALPVNAIELHNTLTKTFADIFMKDYKKGMS
jgi:hypothetical protein